MTTRLLPFALLLLAAGPAPLPPAEADFRAHVAFLASDALKGRAAGSEDYEVAAAYVAAQFAAAGLEPAGDAGSYLQRVPLVSYKAADKGNLVLTRRGGAPVPLVFGEDFIPAANPARAETVLDAPVVFVGRGIVAPQYKRDDYAGIDATGKIVALIPGSPKSYTGEERAHFGSVSSKTAVARARGAVGVIVLSDEALNGGDGWDKPRVTWATPAGTGPADGAPVLATLSPGGGAKLFAGARTPWKDVQKRMRDPEARFTPEALPVQLTGATKTSFTPMASSNVAGLLPGSDPALEKEVVVLSAHLDHLGVGPAVKGDAIYNGAEDNAVGIATLIEEARRFRASGKPPRRSVLFLAVTAEEKGLVGSDYFARHPTLGARKMVADVNLDMPILTFAFKDLIAFGAEHSTMVQTVARAAAGEGVGVSPDPMPDMGLFVRSDHYRFVQQGVPSVFVWPGHAGGGKAAYDAFFKEHYHKPSDEVTLPIDWAQAVRFTAVNYAIARETADADQRPRWNKGDFFGLLYNGYGAR